MRAGRRLAAVAAVAVCALVAGLQTNLGDHGEPAPFATLAAGDELWRYIAPALTPAHRLAGWKDASSSSPTRSPG